MKLKQIICPICEEGKLISKIGKESQTYKNITKDLNFFYAVCDCCESETATSDDIRKNKREMIKFQKEVDGLLSSSEIKAIRNSLGISIKTAGELFGGGPVGFSKYENDDLVQSLPMDSALRLVRSHPESVYELAKARNIQIRQKTKFNGSTFVIPIIESNSLTSNSLHYSSESNLFEVNINTLTNSTILEVYNNVH